MQFSKLSTFAITVLAVAAITGTTTYATQKTERATPSVSKSTACIFCLMPPTCPRCATDERCEISPKLCTTCGTAVCRKLTEPVGGNPEERAKTEQQRNNDPEEKAQRRAGRCVMCLREATCPSCAASEMCVITLSTCKTCSQSACVPRE